MIVSLRIQNFRSILDLTVDFTYGEGKAPNGYHEQEILPFHEAADKKRLVPCMAFFGANASGKTNILKAIGRLRQLVIKGGTLAERYEPNLLNPKFSHTILAIEFFVEGEFFKYQLAYNAAEILGESLLKNEKLVYSIQSLKAEFAQQILSDTYSQSKLNDILRVECSEGDGRQIKPFLHRIGQGYPGLHQDLRYAFLYFINKLQLRISNNSSEYPVLLPLAVQTLVSALKIDEQSALREITEVVRRLDIDITTIDINKRELSPDEEVPNGITRSDSGTGIKHLLQITTTHQDIGGNPASLDFVKHESAGTQRLAGLVGLILYTLKTGGVLLVDELESSLHPLLMREIVMMFKLRRHNPKGAQLIATTHNTDILDDSILRLSEIALVRKTKANGTLVRRLVEIKKDGEDIRNVTNFRKQYLAGFYSGIPHPAI